MANPYHDKEGKFTSKDKQGSAEPKFRKKVQKISLKAGVDLSNFPAPQQVKTETDNEPQSAYGGDTGIVNPNVELTMPTSIEDAVAQGNNILGSSVIVDYRKDTNLEQAFELNKGLKAVASEFPKLFEDKRLLSYGTVINQKLKNISYDESKNIIRNMFNKPEYDEARQSLQKGGIDLTMISKMFAKSFFAKNILNEHNFDRDRTCGGVTVVIGNKGIKYIRSPDSVQLNPNHMRNIMEKSIQVHNACVRNNHYLPCGDKTPTFATSTHELGHHCLNQLWILLDDNERQQLTKVLGNPHLLLALGEISGYATTNKEEEIAEAFSDYFCRGDGATRTNKNIYKFFKGVYDRVFGAK